MIKFLQIWYELKSEYRKWCFDLNLAMVQYKHECEIKLLDRKFELTEKYKKQEKL